METIFDYNPTNEELKRFGGLEAFRWLDSNGLQRFTNEDDANYALGLLFCLRKDYKKAKTYFNKIKKRSMLSTLVQDF